ncbi:MAG: HAD family hydrolase [Arenicella sp.]
MALALFDLDNTLIMGDSDHAWGLFLAEIGAVNAEQHKLATEKFYADYIACRLDINEFLDFQLLPLKKHSMADLMNWRETFMQEKIQHLITPERIELVEQHRNQGDTLIIITATNSFITRPIADAFNIETLIATEPEQDSHGFTGKVDGVACFQAGKITKLNQWLAANEGDLSGSWFYSDSYNDLPLLQQVTHPVCVTPDESLTEHATRHNWPIIR